MITIKSNWTGGRQFVHVSETGHALVSDSPGNGGADTAATPMELVLAGLAGCAGVDLVAILEKMKQPLKGLVVTTEAERANEHPRVYTRIRLHIEVHGLVEERKLQRAIDLTFGTYCSVASMLAETAQISHDAVILPHGKVPEQ